MSISLSSAFLTFYALCLGFGILRRGHLGRKTIVKMADERQKISMLESTHQPTINVILLLPLLREQPMLEGLLDAIDALTFPTERLLVVPITTEVESANFEQRAKAAQMVRADLQSGSFGWKKIWIHSSHFSVSLLRQWANTFDRDPVTVLGEIDTYVHQADTRQTLQTMLRDRHTNKVFRHVHYPHRAGNKASQMNYALDMLRKEGHISEAVSTYIGVYDADSRPPPSSLLALSVAANQDRAAAFQQYPIYLGDVDESGYFMNSEAWLQTAHSVCVEIPRQLSVNSAITANKRFGSTFTYCIGHGEFLRADWLLNVQFPEKPPIDDLPTGIMLSLAQQRIVPLPIFDLCGVPHSIFDLFRQTANWFLAQSDYQGPFERAKSFGLVPPLRRIRCVIEQLITNIGWAGRGVFRVTVLISAINTLAWPLLLLIVLLFFIEAMVYWNITRKLIDSQQDWAGLPRLPFRYSSITRPFLQSIGPCLSLYRQVMRRKSIVYKTER